MKHSPLNRSTKPWRRKADKPRTQKRSRKPMPKRKARMRAVRKGGRRNEVPGMAAEFHQTHDRCAACHRPRSECSRGLQRHHPLGGKFGRHDHIANQIALCSIFRTGANQYAPSCHDLATGDLQFGADGNELPTLELEHCLWLLRETHPELYTKKHRRELQAFMGSQRLPRAVKPPREFFIAREKWDGVR